MTILLTCIFVSCIFLSYCAENIVLIIADDLDIFLDGMVNMKKKKKIEIQNE